MEEPEPSVSLHVGEVGEAEVPAVASHSSIGLSSEEELVPVSLKPAGASIIRRPGQHVSAPRGNVRFNEVVTVRRTWAKRDYDRKVRGETVAAVGGWVTEMRADDLAGVVGRYPRQGVLSGRRAHCPRLGFFPLLFSWAFSHVGVFL